MTDGLSTLYRDVDRHWRLVSANKAVGLLLAGVEDLLRQPVNVLRVALHPNGLAPRTVNLAEGGRTYWRGCAARSS